MSQIKFFYFREEKFKASRICAFVYSGCWHFDNGATTKIDDVPTEHGELIHVLPIIHEVISGWVGLGGVGVASMEFGD